MLDVLRDNRVFFASQAAGIALLTLLAQLVDFPLAVDVPLTAVCVVSLAWMVSVLLTAGLVPDRCNLCRFDWIKERVRGSPKNIAVVHAGLDDVADQVKRTYPLSTVESVDIYDVQETPGNAIARRRAAAPAPKNAPRRGLCSALPLTDGSMDVVVLAFALRELRRRESRAALLRESCRLLADGGTVYVVEQPRTLLGILAFGPEAAGLMTEEECLRLATEAGLELQEAATLTALVELFHFTETRHA